jgi:Domain of unknown function (DUF4276)
MKRLLVLVEGQTEEVFVNRVLQPHLLQHDVFATPTIIETRHLPGRPRDKGGVSSWAKARRDIVMRLRDTDAVTTTIMDFYGLPDDFPGQELPRTTSPLRDVEAVEAAMAAEFRNPRFLPFLALHEFEAWVLSSPDTIATHFGRPGLKATIGAVTSSFPSIEHINHGPETHPSRRLMSMIPEYKKRSDGPTILEIAGVALVRAQCAHFDDWLSRLEELR